MCMWTTKEAECQRTDVFELWCWRRLLRLPWRREIKPINLKGNRFWIFIERTDAEAEASVLWPPDAKNWLTGKDPEAGKDWRWEKGMTENEMVGWHHWLVGHEFEKVPGVGDGQGSLTCYSPWGCKESDMTTGKTIALIIWVFVSKVISLLFNMLSRFVLAFFHGASIF